jgi:two-component sensor histidine kinase/PAS domain-containing protein
MRQRAVASATSGSQDAPSSAVDVKDFGLRSFAIAGAIMVVAVALRGALDAVLPGLSPFIILYPAVALAGLLCGPAPAAVAGLIGLAAAIFLWIPPRLSIAVPNLTDSVSIALFVVSSSIIVWAAAALRARLNAADVARYGLELGLAAGGVGTWEINLRTMRIAASSASYAMHGVPENKRRTTPEDWLRGVHPEDEAAARTALQKALADGTQASYTYRIFGGADGPRWINVRGKVVSSGRDRRLLCALVDITDQVRMQDELRHERERLRLALEAGSLAVWDFNLGTGAATIDTTYARTMDLDPGVKSLTPEQIGERIHPDDLPRVAAEHEALLASGAEYHIEYRVITSSGDVRWLASQGIRIKGDVASDPGRLIGIVQDITDRQRREDNLRDLAAARELLVREADHRIKNSLQLAISLLSVQLRGIEDRAAADALRGAITRISAIAASHLALQSSADLKDVDLTIVLKDLCAHFSQLNPGVAILYRPSGALMLDADRAIPLGLTVSEVITNALRHAFPETSYLVVRIRDDGVGMQPQAAEAGLGSRIIRSLAAQLAAKIEVDSAPGAGTLVTLRLPLHQKQPAAA